MIPPKSPPAITDGVKSQIGQNLLKNTESVRVEVGDVCSRLEFWTLPKTLLIYHSPFFASAMNGSFLEASGTVKLPEDDPDIFGLFVQWLYIGKEYLSKLWGIGHEHCPAICVKAWKLGDKLGCLAFRDFVMICLINIQEYLAIEASLIRFAYESTPPGSKLRKWAVDQFVHDSSRCCYLEPDGEVFEIGQLRDLEDWGFDLADGVMRAAAEKTDPWKDGNPYLEVLEFQRLDDM